MTSSPRAFRSSAMLCTRATGRGAVTLTAPPNQHNPDTLFSDRKMYNKNGTLKGGAPMNIANWTNETFIAMLANIKSALGREVTADDFRRRAPRSCWRLTMRSSRPPGKCFVQTNR